MTNTTDKAILTDAGKALLAQLNAEEKPLVIDKMIFANVPSRPELPQPGDIVPSDHIVHEADVEQRGRLSLDSVIYSTTLTSEGGPFEFNWTGAYCSEYGVLVTIDHHALTPKTANEPGVSGNTLVRSMVLEYKDIAAITHITVDASTWQYDAHLRMKKMDTDLANAIVDLNDKEWFVGDGFLVTPTGTSFSIKSGAGYLSGFRVTLDFDRSIKVLSKPAFIYVDAYRKGMPNGEQATLFDFVVTEEDKGDYTDSKGVEHFVCKIAYVLSDGSVNDLRSKGELRNWVAGNYRELEHSSTYVDTFPDLLKCNPKLGDVVKTRGHYKLGDGGAADYIIVDSDSDKPSFSVALSGGLFAVMTNQVINPLQVGYRLNVDELDSTAKVAANWAILKQLLKDLKTSTRQMMKFNRFWHPEQIHAEWLSGRSAPIGFYSDSTTDGATTTSHTPSVGTTNPFQVIINESPNAYPAKLEQYINDLNKKSTAVRCYNGGFDSQSFANGFGLQQWYNTWFRPAGSNVDFSDVKMIVIGFGTSDSINLNDTATVLDDYSIDVECVIVDCFLRGVQPALQTPVMTTMHVGDTVSYRDGDQSITIIEAVQSQLAGKYDLDHFSFYEQWEKAVRNFTGYKYRDFISKDMVHPNNMGHRVHAAYLSTKFCRRYASLEEGQKFTNIFAGHPAFIPADDSEIIAPDFRGGLILKPIVGTQANESYYYGWLESDGNGKAPGDVLLELNVYVEKPCVLYQTAVQNNRKKKHISIESFTLDGTSGGTGNLFDEYQQPETLYHTHKQFITFLTFGMNKIYVNASSDGPDQMLGGFYLVDMDEVPNLAFGRGTSGSAYIEKSIIFPDVSSNYTAWTGLRRNQGNVGYYNNFDNHNLSIAFQLATNFSAGQTYQIFTHYNDLDDYQQGHNIVEIAGDNITLKVSTKSGASIVVTKTVPGLNAKLVYGANIDLLFQSRFYADEGAYFYMQVDGVSLFTHQTELGQIWTDGYGFDAQTFMCKNIRITSRLPFSSPIDINRYF